MENERLVSFDLLGQEFKFYTAATEDELRIILNMVRQLIETASPQGTGTMVTGKIGVLACLNIASQYVKLKQDFESYKADSEDRLCRLREEIRNTLLAE